MYRRTVFIILSLLFVSMIGCQAAEPEVVEVEVPVEVTRIVEVMIEAEPIDDPANVNPSLRTDVLSYDSENGRSYTAYVTLPLSYEVTEQSYPVLYVTDGDWYTLPTAMAAAQLAFGGEMPEVITVGIGYGGSAMDTMEQRERDLTPAGAPYFLQFMEEELIPDIEENYRADSAVRTLMGHSLGGDFSLYALFNAPETFGQIVASSPSCNKGCMALEEKYAEANESLPVRLFMSVGEHEGDLITNVENLDQTLMASNYDDMTCELAVLNGETHLSARPRAFTTGMKQVFASEG